VNLKEFARRLRERSRCAPRFRVDRYVQDVPAMLLECYRYQVERRGYGMMADEAVTGRITRAAAWLTNPDAKPGLMLYGRPGNGKTTLARAMSQLINILYDNAISTERKQVVSVHASQLADAARGEKDEFLSMLKSTELLYIDDVGTEPSSIKVWGNEVSPLVDLLYYRYDRQLFTLITSNLIGDDDIEKRYGTRIADRFSEMFDLLGFDNGSYRPKLRV